MVVLELAGRGVFVRVDEALRITFADAAGRAVWESAHARAPSIVVRSFADASLRRFSLSGVDAPVSYWSDGAYVGKSLQLERFGNKDDDVSVSLAVRFGIDESEDELLVEIEQVGGDDTVTRIDDFYRWEKPVWDGGHLVLPHGSGYLIPADCPDELPGQGFDGGLVGARWSLPVFGIVGRRHGLCTIIDSWWDCNVSAEHVPGERSALSVSWIPSLGALSYARRMLVRIEPGMDYVGMAKRTRRHAQRLGLLRTLEEKAVSTPQVRRETEQVLFRWPAWNGERAPVVLEQVKALRKAGFDVKFFFPKWHSTGFSPQNSKATTADSGWQAYLLDEPAPGGWPTLAGYAEAVRRLGCSIQCMVSMRPQHANGPKYDDGRWPHAADGETVHDLSGHDAVKRLRWVLESLSAHGLGIDVLYFDGYSAFTPLREDWSPSHIVTRRESYEAQNACFAETRRLGIVPSAELARFWCIADCDYFFFTDWSSDRLSNRPNQHAPKPVGEPVPLFQLVFHDCFIAGFSGGGYSTYAVGYDWWEDRNPRLYELLFGSSPSYNWLPDSDLPIPDMQAPNVRRKLEWLRRWSAFYRGVAMSEMSSHEFVSEDRKVQRVSYANGASAEFDFAGNRFRVSGVRGFDGEWETAPDLS